MPPDLVRWQGPQAQEAGKLARLVAVEHESPQAILVSEGRAIWNDSHLALKSPALVAAVSESETESKIEKRLLRQQPTKR